MSRARRTLILLIGAVLLSVQDARADAPLAGPEDAARSFQFEGIGFSMMRSEFRKKYPAATLLAEESEPELDLQCYRLTDLPAADALQVYFYSDRMHKMRIIYVPARVAKLGGASVIVNRLVKRFGKAESDSRGNFQHAGTQCAELHWKFGGSDRYIQCIVMGIGCVVEFVDTHVEAAIQARREAAADLGF